MAVIDPLHDAVVIRVVYDGPPMAGKTSSVQALARALGGQVVVPEEVAGRTLFFDWLDYTGGLFEGRRIRCQIVSVPGQDILASRRRHLLESADVVVFVGDSAPQDQPAMLRHLQRLHALLADMPGPPIGVVLQANKRDRPDAVSLDVLRAMLDGVGSGMALVESVAVDGTGIREAFVLAVRLALDRVRDLMQTGQLPFARPDVDSAQDLLATLQRLEGDGAGSVAHAAMIKHWLASSSDAVMPATALAIRDKADHSHEVATATRSMVGCGADATVKKDDTSPPLLPAGDLPSGMIWPPVHGRVILHAAMAAPVPLTREANGDWMGVAANAWLVHTPAAARYASEAQGHAALVVWARIHADSAQVLSSNRCIVLCPDGTGYFRLWQCVRIERSLRDGFDKVLTGGGAAVVRELLLLTRTFLQAAERFPTAACPVPLGLRHIGVAPAGVCYLGTMPAPQSAHALPPLVLDAAFKLLAAELAYALPALRSGKEAALTVLDQMSVAKGATSLNAIYRFVRKLFESHDGRSRSQSAR